MPLVVSLCFSHSLLLAIVDVFVAFVVDVNIVIIIVAVVVVVVFVVLVLVFVAQVGWHYLKPKHGVTMGCGIFGAGRH